MLRVVWKCNVKYEYFDEVFFYVCLLMYMYLVYESFCCKANSKKTADFNRKRNRVI